MSKFSDCLKMLSVRMSDEFNDVFTEKYLSEYIVKAIDTMFTQSLPDAEKVFPELLGRKQTLVTKDMPIKDIDASCYTIKSANTYLGEEVRILEPKDYSSVKAGRKPYIHPSKQRPIMFEINNKIVMLPEEDMQIEFIYLINPNIPKPSLENDFVISEIWIPKIVDTAEALLRKDLQQS